MMWQKPTAWEVANNIFLLGGGGEIGRNASVVETVKVFVTDDVVLNQQWYDMMFSKLQFYSILLKRYMIEVWVGVI